MRKRRSTDQKNRVTLIASFDSHCIFTVETPPTRLSIEERSCVNCETMSTYVVLDVDKKTTWADVCKNVCQKSTLADLHETIHGTACGMYAMYLKQLSSYPCPSGEELLETLNVTESESTRWRDSFDLCGVRPGFWRGRGQDETHRKGCEHTQFCSCCCLPCRVHCTCTTAS